MKKILNIILISGFSLTVISCGLITEESSDTVAVDTAAPTASVTTATITTSENAVVQSTETGTAYLVNTAVLSAISQVSLGPRTTSQTVSPSALLQQTPICRPQDLLMAPTRFMLKTPQATSPVLLPTV